jgi:tetratricopeptide (TPR) repeat protein
MGDRTGYDEAHAELVRQATRYDSRRSRQLVADKESVRAVNAGDFETGIRYAEEAFGASSKRADAKIILQSRKSYVAMEQGRLDEARALWASTLENEEMRLMAVAAGAGIEAEAGNTELASKFLDHYFEEALRRFPVNPLRWSGLCFISQVVTALDRSDLAAPLYEALMPGRGLLCHAAVAGVSGDVDRQLAIMATLVGNYDAAEQHFTEALEVEGRMLAPRLQARTKYWYARMLLKRDGPGDRSHAQQLLASSLAIASELGLAKVAEDARTLLAPPEQESGEGG